MLPAKLCKRNDMIFIFSLSSLIFIFDPYTVFTVGVDLAMDSPSEAKARISDGPLTARLKPCPTQNRTAVYGNRENGLDPSSLSLILTRSPLRSGDLRSLPRSRLPPKSPA